MMTPYRTTTTISAYALLLACASCDRAPTSEARTAPSQHLALSTAEQATLIFGALGSEPCREAVIEAGSVHDTSPEGYAQGMALDAWRERTLIAHPETYTLEQTERSGRGWTGLGPKTTEERFAHEENGQRLTTRVRRTWGRASRAMGMKTDPQYMQVAMAYCEWIPSHVEIVGTSGPVSDTMMTVSYRLLWKASAIAQLASAAPSTAVHPTSQPTPPVAEVTLMRDSKGMPWQVVASYD